MIESIARTIGYFTDSSVTLSTNVESYTAFFDSLAHLMNQLGSGGQIAVGELPCITIYDFVQNSARDNYTSRFMTLLKSVLELDTLELFQRIRKSFVNGTVIKIAC